jgi:hypothetical protein
VVACISESEDERANRIAVEVEGIICLKFDRIIQTVERVQDAIDRMVEISNGFRCIDLKNSG